MGAQIWEGGSVHGGILLMKGHSQRSKNLEWRRIGYWWNPVLMEGYSYEMEKGQPMMESSAEVRSIYGRILC